MDHTRQHIKINGEKKPSSDGYNKEFPRWIFTVQSVDFNYHLKLLVSNYSFKSTATSTATIHSRAFIAQDFNKTISRESFLWNFEDVKWRSTLKNLLRATWLVPDGDWFDLWKLQFFCYIVETTTVNIEETYVFNTSSGYDSIWRKWSGASAWADIESQFNWLKLFQCIKYNKDPDIKSMDWFFVAHALCDTFRNKSQPI